MHRYSLIVFTLLSTLATQAQFSPPCDARNGQNNICSGQCKIVLKGMHNVYDCRATICKQDENEVALDLQVENQNTIYYTGLKARPLASRADNSSTWNNAGALEQADGLQQALQEHDLRENLGETPKKIYSSGSYRLLHYYSNTEPKSQHSFALESKNPSTKDYDLSFTIIFDNANGEQCKFLPQ